MVRVSEDVIPVESFVVMQNPTTKETLLIVSGGQVPKGIPLSFTPDQLFDLLPKLLSSAASYDEARLIARLKGIIAAHDDGSGEPLARSHQMTYQTEPMRAAGWSIGSCSCGWTTGYRMTSREAKSAGDGHMDQAVADILKENAGR